MAGHGAPRIELAAEGSRVAIVASSWHETIMTALVDSAVRTCEEAGAEATVFRVPGSFELALAADTAALSGFDAVVALGVIIRGGTPHFDFVCHAATEGLNRVALDNGVPVGFGVLTCDSEEQALDRAGLPGSAEDKGREATEAALGLLATLADIRAGVADRV